jgi:Flp pilus assembly protein TadB
LARVGAVVSRRAVSVDVRVLGLAVGAGLLAWVVTGWPVAVIAAALGAVGVPRFVGARRQVKARIDRLDALASWTRRLADTLTAGAGLEQALQASVRTAPAALAEPVGRLVARLRAQQPTEGALRAFAADLADPAGDLVAAALIAAADRRGRGLAAMLTELAATVEEEAAMRRKVDAERATVRTTVKYAVGIPALLLAALLVFDRGYLAPFGTTAGQFALAAAGALFGLAFVWMHRLSLDRPGARWLAAREDPR